MIIIIIIIEIIIRIIIIITIMSQPESRWDNEPKKKENGFKKRLRVATTVIFGKLWKTIKIRQVYEKNQISDPGVGI